jgi:hypothetical protein
MKPIRLAAVRHEEPDCLDYDDEAEVRYEIAMRVHRAHSEAYSVTPLDGRVDGAYRVLGRTGANREAITRRRRSRRVRRVGQSSAPPRRVHSLATRC